MNTVAKRNLFRTPGAVCRLVCGALLAAAASGCADRQPNPGPEIATPRLDDIPADIVTQTILHKTHDLHGRDGKVVRGRIHAYNPDTETATIAREDGKMYKVRLDTLSEADQARVREWHRLKDFFSQSRLRISVQMKGVKGKQEYPLLKEHIWRWEDKENLIYVIKLENRRSSTLPNLTLAYRIHSRKKHPEEPKSPEIKILKTGTFNMGTLAAGKTVELKTEPVPQSKSNPFNYYTDDGSFGAPTLSIRIRVFLPMADGRKAMREISTLNIPQKNPGQSYLICPTTAYKPTPIESDR